MPIFLGRVDEFPVDVATPLKVEGEALVVIRRPDGSFCVFIDKCPHAGLSLTKGPRGGYADGVITCPWHNSRFDVCSGENLDWTPGVAGVKVPSWSRRLVALGKSPSPLEVRGVEVRDGAVYLTS